MAHKKRQFTRQGQFAFWSVIFLISSGMALYRDYFPEWRSFQVKFNDLTVELAEKEIARENAKIQTLYTAKLDQLEGDIQRLADENRSLNQESDVAEQQGRIAELAQIEYEKGQALSFAKSLLGNYRSVYEFLKNDEHANPEEIAAAKVKYDRAFAEVQELTPGSDEAYDDLLAANAKLKEMQKGPGDLVRERDEIYAEMIAWKAEVEKINPSDIIQFTANTVRDIPLLDFLGPRFNLNQIVLEDIPDLTKSAKVDRCTTCHLGIDNTRYDAPDVPEPFRTHPDLNLYVGKDSPHPVDKFGCTSCHFGRGYGTTFTLASHTPNDQEQAARWKEEYGWKELHYWDFPMLPKRFDQAGCFTCHKPALGYELTASRTVFEGRKIYERRGCHGCHKIAGVSDEMSKIGPSLENINAKLNADWVPRWVSAPRKFYETARMPHGFGHRIPSDDTFAEMVEHTEHELGEDHFDELYEEMVTEDAAIIDSIAAYLFDVSGDLELDEPPAERGDPEVGRDLVNKINCLGCHKIDDLNAPGQGFGPDLSKVGSKTNRKWLYNWLRNPKKYWPDGNMPDPRLSDDEANHITAYLLTQRDDDYMEREREVPTDKSIDDVTIKYLRAKMGKRAAEAEAAKMDQHQKMIYVGKEAIYRNGCFGCHEVPGFEGLGRIGAELTAEGFKEIELFDFGMYKYVHIPHTRHDWIEQKVKQPQIYVLGKVTNPYEQALAMPWFGFSDEETRQISTFILGQSGKAPPAKYLSQPTGDKAAILEGRKIIERKNCQGCHQIGLGGQFVDTEDFDFRKHLVWVTDPVVAKYDKNLPEGKYVQVAQVPEADISEKDMLIIPRDGFVDGEVIFGDDYYGIDEVFGEDEITVDIGAGDEVRVALDRPDRLLVNGLNEGYIARFYDQAALAPPILRNEGEKVRPEWFFDFLRNVRTVRNHIEVRMPQWEWTDEEATAVVRYFAAASTDPEPFPYKSEDHPPLGESQSATALELFGIPGTDEYRTTLQCFGCHPAGELLPTSPKSQWGPDLYLASDRLKTSFIESWLRFPPNWAPGTNMPGFFYDREGTTLIDVPPASPAVAARGTERSISELAELLYRLPEMEDIAAAAAAEAERRKLEPPPAAEEEEDFDEDFDDEDFDD